ncbi:MAG: ATP synthase F0 subunit C [Phycisphaerae bacterium]|jgi:F-type H+-transporting ATPase subunit c|nr:ATP synthase F0 subunit C [Phycisphaerae bacterium]
MSKTVTIALMLLIVVCVSGVVLAEGSQATSQPDNSESKAKEPGIVGSITVLAGCFGAAGCAIGGGLAIARLASTCIESMARQPEAAGSMFLPMIIAAGMIEGAILFAIVVCIMAVGA